MPRRAPRRRPCPDPQTCEIEPLFVYELNMDERGKGRQVPRIPDRDKGEGLRPVAVQVPPAKR